MKTSKLIEFAEEAIANCNAASEGDDQLYWLSASQANSILAIAQELKRMNDREEAKELWIESKYMAWLMNKSPLLRDRE